MIGKLFLFQIKVINFINAIVIAYLNTCNSVLIQKIQCIFLIRNKFSRVDQNNSVGSGDYRESANEKESKNFNSKPLNFRKKTQISIKIFENLHFLTFSVWVVEISNKHFCNLNKKFLRNFCSWQMFVFVTVHEIFGFELAILCNEVAIF